MAPGGWLTTEFTTIDVQFANDGYRRDGRFVFVRRFDTASPSHLQIAVCASQELSALVGKPNRYIGCA
jgi:hypothetical protein